MSESNSTETARQSLLDLAEHLLRLATGTSQVGDFEVVIKSATTRLAISPSQGVQQSQQTGSAQEAILNALDGRVLSPAELARAVGIPLRMLVRTDGIIYPMMERGLIAWEEDAGGIYRTNPRFCRSHAEAKAVTEEPQRAIAFKKKRRYIYCIECASKQQIKIGIAVDPAKRLVSLRSGTADYLQLLGIAEGNRQREMELHERFASFRVAGEWFEDCPEIRAFIANEMQPWPLP